MEEKLKKEFKIKQTYDFDEKDDKEEIKASKKKKIEPKDFLPEANDWTEDDIDRCNIDLVKMIDITLIDKQIIPPNIEFLAKSNDLATILKELTGDQKRTDWAWEALPKINYENQKPDQALNILIRYYSKVVNKDEDYSESNVDAFVNYLFNYLDLSSTKDRTEIIGNVPTKITIFEDTKSVTPDVSVTIKLETSIKRNIQLVTCEDKTRQNIVKKEDLRAQAIAEVIAAYQTNIKYRKINDPIRKLFVGYKMPFLTVHGSSFSFYIVDDMTDEYITDIQKYQDFQSRLNIIIIKENLSFDEQEERSLIIKILIYFKELIHLQAVKLLQTEKNELSKNVKLVQ